VPVHFGWSGAPDRWGTPLELLSVHACVISFATALFSSLPQLIRWAPAALINLPNKQYWLTPENREIAAAKFAGWSNIMGTAINGLMIALQLLLWPSRVSNDSAPSLGFWFVLVTFVAFTVCWCAWLIAAYRLPTRATK
jgi:hypothetical protein